MSCQQASRAQEDPYAFTESAPLQANSLLYASHSSAVNNSGANSTTAGGSTPVTSSTTVPASPGTSLLLTSSSSVGDASKDNLEHVATPQQHVRVTASSTLKVRYNGVVTTTTVATAGAQRSPVTVTTTPVFTKSALQTKQQPAQQPNSTQSQLQTAGSVGKPVVKKVIPQHKAPLVTTVVAGGAKVVSQLQPPQVASGQQQQQQSAILSTGGGSILKFIKIPSQQLGKGVSTSGAVPQGSFIHVTTSNDGGRKLLATSSNVINSSAAAAAAGGRNVANGTTVVPSLPTVSSTKIRLIQPQSHGKIFLQASNSNNVTTAAQISNPISIAALRNSLVKQQQLQQLQQQQQQLQQQQQPPQKLPQPPPQQQQQKQLQPEAQEQQRLQQLQQPQQESQQGQQKQQKQPASQTLEQQQPQPQKLPRQQQSPKTQQLIQQPALQQPQAQQQPLKQQHVLQQSPSRHQLQTQQAVQLQQLPQQPKQKQPPNSVTVVHQQQALPAKPILKQGSKQQQQQHNDVQLPLPAASASQQPLPSQASDGRFQNLAGAIQPLRSATAQQSTGVSKSPLQINLQQQAASFQLKQSLLLQSPKHQHTAQQVQLATQQTPTSLLVQQKQLQLAQPQTKVRQAGQLQQQQQQQQPSPKAHAVMQQGVPIATAAVNGSLAVKVNNTIASGQGATAATVANVVNHSKPTTSEGQQAALQGVRRSSSTQQSLLIVQQQQQQQQAVQVPPHNADKDRNVTLVGSLNGTPKAMKLEAKSELAVAPTSPAGIAEMTEKGLLADESVDSRVAGLPSKVKVKQQAAGRKAVSVGKASAKQVKSNKRSYNHRSVDHRPESMGMSGDHPCPPVSFSVSSNAASVSSSSSESFQAAFAKMARPAVPESTPTGEAIPFHPLPLSTPKSSKVKKEIGRKLCAEYEQESGTGDVKPPKQKFVAPKVPGAIVVPITRPKVKDWHAPGSYMFDLKDPGDGSDEDAYEDCASTLSFWYEESIAISVPDSSTGWGMRPMQARGPGGKNKQPGGSLNDVKFHFRMLTRDERLELKKAYLQRRAVQCRNGLRMRNLTTAKRKLKSMGKLLAKLEKRRTLALIKESEKPKCIHDGCEQAALVMASHCYDHITENMDQLLFPRCTAKFSDNSQCRLPVFDISHELVLCKEHAWKHDNHDKMSQEVKLQKKPPSVVSAVALAGGASIGQGSNAASLALAVACKKAKPIPPVAAVRPQKRPKKKKKLSPLQQQMMLHQQQLRQFVAANKQQHAHRVQVNHTTNGLQQQQQQQQHPVNVATHNAVNIVYQKQQIQQSASPQQPLQLQQPQPQQQQQQQQQKEILVSSYNNGMMERQQPLEQMVNTSYPSEHQYVANGDVVGVAPVKHHGEAIHANEVGAMENHNLHIPLMSADSNSALGPSVYQDQQSDATMQLVEQLQQSAQHHQQQGQQQQEQQQHEVQHLQHQQQLPDDQLVLNYIQEQQLHQQHMLQQQQLQHQQPQPQHQQQQQQQQQQHQQQQHYGNGTHAAVQPMLNASATQDMLTICENSSAYASSEDTGVGGLSESELMATQEVIEEIIPFEIGNLLNTNVLSQLAPDALNELLFAGGEQEEHDTGAPFEGTARGVEDDIERALEHVKSLDDMAVESANFLGDFLENVDDEMLDGSDICSTEQILQSPNNANDIRGLVHT